MLGGFLLLINLYFCSCQIYLKYGERRQWANKNCMLIFQCMYAPKLHKEQTWTSICWYWMWLYAPLPLPHCSWDAPITHPKVLPPSHDANHIKEYHARNNSFWQIAILMGLCYQNWLSFPFTYFPVKPMNRWWYSPRNKQYENARK